VFLAQLNVTVGDVDGNSELIARSIARARALGADLAVYPEMAICGYPPEDLLLRTSFLDATRSALDRLALESTGITAIVGLADRDMDLYNAAAVLHDGEIAAIVHKAHLPTYSVFDEARYFRSGECFPVFERGGVRFGVSICEDIWVPSGPAHLQALAGADVLVNISASPFSRKKGADRERMITTRAIDDRAFIVYCNLVGGQDELVFDGRSLVISPTGAVLERGLSFEQDEIVADLNLEQVLRERLLDPRRRQAWRVSARPEMTPEIVLPPLSAVPYDTVSGQDEPMVESERGDSGFANSGRPIPEPLGELEEVYNALVLGTRDYTLKNGFATAVVGVSGGIDSALTAAIAVDALGPENVVGVAMPSRYSSPISLEDAQSLADNLGFELLAVSIDGAFQSMLDALAPHFQDLPQDVTEENLQPRIRGNIVMALSNKFGHLVLTTGNKSEIGVGYSTLYGDTAGGFAPLKDVPKTLVYQLAEWRNECEDGPWIPERSISRAPTAELKHDQTDEDVLPPYEILDPILELYVEDEAGVSEIVALGFDPEIVTRVVRMVDRAEYKRRQSPPGVKISERAFGRDRRMPITRREHKPEP
jgi:NAD+ synthase (glutamine-hydrolysing)